MRGRHVYKCYGSEHAASFPMARYRAHHVISCQPRLVGMRGLMRVSKVGRPGWLGIVAGMACCSPADAQSVPFSDTEDASLGELSVGDGSWHPIGRLNLRNGDYARGGYDDDSSNLNRVPVHVELGLVYDLKNATAEAGSMWLEFHSSNGFHAPSDQETRNLRSWYESNNLVGFVYAPVRGLRAGLSYTVKTSPNDVAATSHEASVVLSYQSDRGLGWLHPNVVGTIRPRGGQGLYTQLSIEPEWKLGEANGAPSISLPVLVGIGWGGFYKAGSHTIGYRSVGLAVTQPFMVGSARASLHGEIGTLVRDRMLARLDGDDANRATVVPIGQITLSFAY